MKEVVAPFAHIELLNLAYTYARDDVQEIFQESPDGVLLVTNPLILPEPKYTQHSDLLKFTRSLGSFRDEVVCWGTPLGIPDRACYVTALSKLWLSWVFGLPSGEVPAWALPYGVTRFRGGFPLVCGSARLVAAYSGASEKDDERFARSMVAHTAQLADFRLESVRRLEHPMVNFLDVPALERIETVREVEAIPSCLEELADSGFFPLD